MEILILLAVVWAAVLLPPYLRNRAESSPLSNELFRGGGITAGRRVPSRPPQPLGPAVAPLPPLARRGGPVDMVPGPEVTSFVRKRRRDVIMAMAGAAAFTFLLAVTFGGMARYLHLATDLAFISYLYLLAQVRRLEAGAPRVLRPLRTQVGNGSLIPIRQVG